MIRVGICGGIGSGKSTVCQLFAERGVAVYYCDSRAKQLMTSSSEIIEQIKNTFGERSYSPNGELNREYLAEHVFCNQSSVEKLNAIVHPAVVKDVKAWFDEQMGDYAIVESALLFSSGLDGVVDFTIAVLAPVSLRIARASDRDGVTADKIRERMAHQMSDDSLAELANVAIVNIDKDDLEHDVKEIDARLRMKAREQSK